MTEREEIRAGLERGESFTQMAQAIGRSVSTERKEV
jgi:IS30 family transposase